MNRKVSRTNRNYIIMGLCAILVIMGVGYAAFSSQLKISGTSNIASNFSVKITDIQSNVQSGSASDAQRPSYTDTTATFKTNLVLPGDSMKYDITVANEGNIDAVLESIDINTGDNDAITFETSGIEKGDKLEASQTDILTVIVSYNSSVTSQPENTNSTITVTLNYKQDDGTVISPTTITPNDLKTLAVTEGDGLYADEYEPGRFIYKGAMPNNYITFNNETWRILSVEEDGSLKIVKNEKLDGSIYWDDNGGFDWTSSSLKEYLNGEYISLLNSELIVNHDWSIGKMTLANNGLANQIKNENSNSWNGKVGLMTASEYLRTNSNTEQCKTMALEMNNSELCINTSWIYDIINEEDTLYLITTTGNRGVAAVLNWSKSSLYGLAGLLYSSEVGIYSSVNPVIYLTPNIHLQGDGSELEPYTISN